ncbi:serine hydrolase [Bacillus alkalisoli]|uniref:serine hydrolase n=1 Tax=Bacillus alkalisoli TaxID=2011008 RepID=UPI000C2504CF|nr:serine hydrolase [Bacillus alkalisoli]
MQNFIEKLKEIESGEIGIIVFSLLNQDKVVSINEEFSVPLASAAKVAIAFCVAKLVEEGRHNWNNVVTGISFNPKEDSKEIYPHFQTRETLTLQEAVEVMIACHDSSVADSIVQFCGGWEKINTKIKTYFVNINITQNPRNLENQGELIQVFEVLRLIFNGYKETPELWSPIITGLVRQRGEIDGIPTHLLNHMTGGLEDVVVDIGILGEFSKNPFLYVLGAKNLPNRNNYKVADELILEAMKLLYAEYLNQERKI